MSNIKSLDKLKEFVEEDNLLVEMIDAVEKEIAERYMLLPVDAYGELIRPDDLMACTAFDTNSFDGKEHVLAVGNGFWVDKHGCTHIPSETRHVKPRTLEDVLADFAPRWMDAFNPERKAMLVEECADEIRELMGVEE